MEQDRGGGGRVGTGQGWGGNKTGLGWESLRYNSKIKIKGEDAGESLSEKSQRTGICRGIP